MTPTKIEAMRKALENARIDFACIADSAGATDGVKDVAQSAIRDIDAALLSTKQEGEGKAIADLREESLRQGIIRPHRRMRHERG